MFVAEGGYIGEYRGAWQEIPTWSVPEAMHAAGALSVAGAATSPEPAGQLYMSEYAAAFLPANERTEPTPSEPESEPDTSEPAEPPELDMPNYEPGYDQARQAA